MNNTDNQDSSFEGLLEYFQQNRGFDFTGYKRSSLMRRVQKLLRSDVVLRLIGVKIYATDVDDEALTQAQQASDTAAVVVHLPDAWRENDFDGAGDRYSMRPVCGGNPMGRKFWWKPPIVGAYHSMSAEYSSPAGHRTRTVWSHFVNGGL